MREEIDKFCQKIRDPKLKRTFRKCFFSTLDTTTEFLNDGTTYIFTGDIPAMWLRDSSAQVIHYLYFADVDDDVKNMIKGLLRRQFRYILTDPYANAFNKEANNMGHKGDITQQNEWVWERKYEVDSLCYPIWLCYRYYQKTKDTEIFDPLFISACSTVLDVFTTEQDHSKSPYFHYRPDAPAEMSVPNGGKGGKVSVNGLTWGGYRPSDDPCQYGYLIPSNMFATVILGYMKEIFASVAPNAAMYARADKLRRGICQGLADCAVYEHKKFGKIYAYETDGLGNYNLMDDANVPSLLSLPYLGYCSEDDEIYQNTRRFVLSKDNPYYFEGRCMRGVGSPHTAEGYVWPISLIIQLMTSGSEAEKRELLQTLLRTDAGTDCMHEGINVNNSSEYTREWFAWANSLFACGVLQQGADAI